MARRQYDAIIIGSGHNGLVCAAYLARAGLRVAVLERRGVLGGCAVTEEPWPGFKVSTLSYVNSLFRPDIVRDLDLRRHGYEMLPRDPSSFTPFPDGRHLLLGPDKAMCDREIRKFSARDADRYPQYEAFLEEVAALLEPLMHSIPPNPGRLDWTELWALGKHLWGQRSTVAGRLGDLGRMLTGSARDLLDDWFESPELKVTLATDGIIGAFASPSMPGTAYVLFHHVMGECNGVRGVWGYMRGGMGGVTQSLAAACTKLGVDLLPAMPVAEVRTRYDRAVGVTTADGTELEAKVVASCATPHVTFLQLCPDGSLPAEFVSQVRKIRYDSASVKINLALAELPDFTACPGLVSGPQHRGTIHIGPDLAYVETAYADALQGRASQRPVLECTIPSTVDATLAPPGCHVMNVFCQYGPYQLAEGSWDTEREAFADRVIAELGRYAPNLPGAVLHRQVVTPVDLEREWGLTGGNLFHGRMSLDQLFALRPVAGWADHRTPLDGLYLCGSGAHPGGGVLGTPGFNAAKVMLQDWRK